MMLKVHIVLPETSVIYGYLRIDPEDSKIILTFSTNVQSDISEIYKSIRTMII